MADAAAPLACMTVSGMSFGSAKVPQTKTPGRLVSSGARGAREAVAVVVLLHAQPPGRPRRPGVAGRMPDERTTRSNSSSLNSPRSFRYLMRRFCSSPTSSTVAGRARTNRTPSSWARS